ncbi:MAG: hypothetical protein O2901_03440 [Verrucomicrobia bacterium]|nr:hypothetical protein [Verrucomicrobiota bacterium]
MVGFNLVVDPLWAFGGNKLFDTNIAFNERLTKIYLFERRKSDPACLILGSSRTTLLDQRDFCGGDSFNLSFSAGRIREFIAYARYLKSKGYEPKVLLVEASMFNFYGDPQREVPDWVDEFKRPPSKWANYMSWDVVQWSRQTLRRQFPSRTGQRYYDQNFACQPIPGLKPYRPAFRRKISPQKYQIEWVELYDELHSVFPNAHYILYAPPVSPWEVYKDYYKNEESFFHVARRLSIIADEFYDFSAPGALTYDTDNSYDGKHFLTHVWKSIANEMDPTENRTRPHLVRPDTFEEYREHYIGLMQTFIESTVDAGAVSP